MLRSQLVYEDALPPPGPLAADALLIYDERLAALGSPALDAFLAGFPLRYAVTAGESLKDAAAFPGHVERLLKLAAPLATARLTVIALGGGSVGDFAGFFASVFRRGVRFVQIPSTWLAALDSAHGGKNALNVGGAKNQLGTFHFPERVQLVRELLHCQPTARAREAFGELAKIALIDATEEGTSPDWVAALSESPLGDGELLWHFLRDAVAAKYRVVEADPLERRGLRQHLNLGHTIGHVLEAAHALPHGLAVAEGLRFALRYSERRGYLPAREHARLCTWLEQRFGLAPLLPELAPLPAPRFRELLLQDKKRDDAAAVRFVFLRAPGQVFTESVDAAELVAEAVRQGYVAAE